MTAYQATFQLRVIQNGRVVTRKHIAGLGKTDATVITAAPGQIFVVADTLGLQNAPSLRLKRVGSRLQVALENGNPDIPDLIIEGYFDHAGLSLVGAASDGRFVPYSLAGLVDVAAAPLAGAASPVAAPTMGEPAGGATGLATTAPAAPAGASSGVVSSSISSAPLIPGGETLVLAGLGALALMGAAGGGGGGSSNVITKIQAFATDGTQAAPTVDDYKALAVTGVTDRNLGSINNAIDALSAADVDTKGKVQGVIDAYVKILAAANGPSPAASSANPTVDDYRAIGVNLGAVGTQPAAFSLFNDVVANLSTSSVDTVAKLGGLAAVVAKVMALADGGNATLTVDDLALMGVGVSGSGAVNGSNLAGVVGAIRAAGGQGGVDTYAELTGLITGIAVLLNYSGDSTQALPTLSHYSGLGITGVTAANLGAINSAMDTLAPKDVDTKAKVQAIVDTYTKILAEANGTAADATPSAGPTVEDYALIGADIGLGRTNAAALNLLNEVVGNLTTAAVDSVAEINALGVVVGKVMNLATGQPNTLTLENLYLLGLPSSGPGAITASNFDVVIRSMANAGGQAVLDTYRELFGVASGMATVVNYANDSTQTPPTLDQYRALGITGVTAANLEAVNSAIDANTGTSVDAKAKIQALVDAYNFILAEANGSASDLTPEANPTAAQYSLLGANIGTAASSPQALSLLNDGIANVQTTDVDTVGEINAIAAAAGAVISAAAGGATVTLSQLRLLGVSNLAGLSLSNLQAIQSAIVATHDSGSDVDTVAELNAIVSRVVGAAKSIELFRTYADDGTTTAPAVADYAAIGVNGVNSGNVAAFNSAVDGLTSSDVDSSSKLQAVVNAYARILAEANGSAADATPGANPSAADYAQVGASIGLAAQGVAGGTNQASSALALLDDSVGALTVASVNTVAKLNQLAAIVDKIMTLAQQSTGTAIPASAVTMTELSSLGLNVSLVNTSSETNAIWQAIINSADDGSGVATVTALQAIINANAS